MLYSKAGQFHHIPFDPEKFKTLDQCKFESGDVYYHHHYDSIHKGIKIYDAVDDAHWQHMKDDSSVKLFHENCGETFDENFAKDIAHLINYREIDPRQVYILLMDNVHVEFLKEKLLAMNVYHVNIGEYNFLLNKIEIPTVRPDTTKTFSALSRNYRAWRLKLYATLADKKLLDNFKYSFYNIHPYEGTTFSQETMRADLEGIGGVITKSVSKWMDKIPYTLSATDNVLNKWGDITYQTVLDAKFHILVETHYDPLQWTRLASYSRSFAPSSITEKTYKPIACAKPFIVFSTPFFLDDLRKLGYKTFSPYIDESYDEEVDNQLRLDKIVNEIERISNLTEEEQTELLNNLSAVLDHNIKLLKSSRPKMGDSFSFILKHVQ